MKFLASVAMAGVALAAVASQPAVAAGSISIEIAQPGVYGRVVVGDVRPAVVYHEPIIVTPAHYAPVRRPIYLYVPPGHQRNWSRHCHRYQACGQPVYFVQESWVRKHHAQHRRHRAEHRHAHPHRQVRHDDRRHAQPPRKSRHEDRRGGDRGRHGGEHRR